MEGNNELIVLFMREFGWTFKYTVNFVQRTPLYKLQALSEELQYQMSAEYYRQAELSASIMATIINTTAKKDKKVYKASDFIGQPPKRRVVGEVNTLQKAAEKLGIIIPEEIGG
ncbi:hypothetical protein LCGC14_2269760 [marine sediment metagenome]|uniref:Uncharacterized protein n=1 Tax=marine sediment metagenome TaxID=412755 RepID=A0A0F9CXA0_9ZZZZ